MTVQDMICLAELWIHLSSTAEGAAVEKIVLPGNLTGKPQDRYFKCIAPKWDGKENWAEYLNRCVDSVDFQETSDADWSNGQS